MWSENELTSVSLNSISVKLILLSWKRSFANLRSGNHWVETMPRISITCSDKRPWFQSWWDISQTCCWISVYCIPFFFWASPICFPLNSHQPPSTFWRCLQGGPGDRQAVTLLLRAAADLRGRRACFGAWDGWVVRNPGFLNKVQTDTRIVRNTLNIWLRFDS